MKLLIFLFGFLVFPCFETTGCFDENLSSSLCHLCNYDAYPNLTSIDWSWSDYPNQSCIPKLSNSQEFEIFVNSSKQYCNNALCDGSMLLPFNDFFVALEFAFFQSLQYLNSNITIFLFGENPFYLYTNNTSQEIFIFRRTKLNITIQPLLCKIKMVSGCFMNESYFSQIIIKNNNILFFISNQMTLRNLQFNGIDIIAFNLISDSISKQIYKNQTLCNEKDLLVENADPLKKLCFLNQISISASSQGFFGFFNIENLYDCDSCTVPKLQIENCEFSFLNFINSNIISLISFEVGLKFNLELFANKLSKVFFPSGILALRNVANDNFYKGFSYSNLVQNIKTAQYCNFQFENNFFSDFNYFQFAMTPESPFSVFNLNLTQISVLNQIPTLTLVIKNNSISNFFQDGNFLIYFIVVSGFNSLSSFALQNNSIVNFSNIYILSNGNSFFTAIFYNSLFDSCKDIFFYFGPSVFTISNVTFQNLIINTPSLIFIEDDLEIKNCSFTNIFSTNNVLVSLIEIGSNLILPQIFISNSNFSNFTWVSISAPFQIYDNFSIIYCSFHSFTLSTTDSMFQFETANFQINSSSFINLIGYSVFRIGFLKNFQLSDLVIYDSQITFFSLYISTHGNPDPNTFIILTRILISNLELFSKYFIYFLICDETVGSCLSGDNIISISIHESDFQEIEWRIDPNPINYIMYIGDFHNVLFDKVNISKVQGEYVIFGDYEYFNAFLVFRDSHILSGNMGLFFVAIVDIDRCVAFQTTFKFIVYQTDNLYYLILRNSNFTSSQLGLNILITSVKWLLITNCHFYQNYNDILFSAKTSDVDPTLFLNPNENLFFSNYFPFCTALPQTLSYEDCESIMRNNSAPIIYIKAIMFLNYTDIFYLFFNNFGIVNSTFEETIGATFLLDETNPTNLVLRNVTVLNFMHENNTDLMIQSSFYNLFFFECTFLNISYIDGSAILLINSNAYFSKCNFFSLNFQSLYDGFLSSLNSKGYFYGITVSQLKAFEFGFLNGEKSYLVFENSTFSDSYVSSAGGFFYFQRSDLIINNCIFMNGNSLYRGGIMFLYLLKSFIMRNSVIKESFVGQSGLIYFESGNINVTHVFTNVSFFLNRGKFGVCIFSKEANVEINNGFYANNSADDSLIYCISQIQNINISMFNSSILNIISNANILYFENQFVTLEYITFSNFSSQTSLVFFSSSNVQMKNCLFTKLKDNSQDNINHGLIIYGSKSLIFSDSLLFNANLYGICIYLQNAEITINNSKFKNCLNAIQNFQSSSLNLFNCSFVDNQGLKSGAIYLSDSNLNVFLSSFEGNFQRNSIFKGGNDIYSQNSISGQMLFLSVSDSKINNSGFISISAQGNYSVNISNTYIFGGKANITQAFFLLNINKFSVFNCSIEQINYYSAIEISNTQIQFLLSIYINLSNFSNCNSYFSGGVLSLGGSHYDINILNSKFKENSAKFYGGALYIYFVETPKISSCKIENNIFVNNRAQISGGAIKIFFENLSTLINLNSFQNNDALSGQNVSGIPVEIQINSVLSTEFYLESVSGSYLQFNISILDIMGNILTTEDGQIIIEQDSHNISNISNLLLLYNKQLLINATASFTMYTFGTPNKTYPIVFSFQNDMTSFNKSGSLNLRPCQRGESQVNSICLPCGTDFYSFDIAMKCQNCPSNAFCPGKDMIIPLKGYWRFHQNSALLKQCLNELSCPDQRQYFMINGSNDYNFSMPFTYFCAKGSYGNLCSNCEKGYGSSSQKLCIKCGISYQTLFLMIFNFLVLMYQSIKSFDTTSADKSQRSLIKLLINHGNYLILLNSFPEILLKNLSYLLSMNKQIDVIGTISDSTIFDCFLQDFVSTENLVLARVAFFSFVPIIIVLSLFVFRIILLIIPGIKNKIGDKNKFRIFVSCFISVIYSFYPKIVNNAFTLLKCISLDEQERSFLEIDPNIQCWQSTHLHSITTVFVPNLLIWCLGWPFCLFMMLFWRKKSRRTTILKEKSLSSKKSGIETETNLITSPSKIKSLFYSKEKSTKNLSEKDKADIFQTHKIYRFLTFEYDVNFYYWDEFFYLTNLLLSICSLLRQLINEVVFSEILLGVFFLLLVIINKCEPFRFREINFICSISFGVIFATFYCIVNLSFLSEEAWVPINFYVVLIFLFNGVFYCYWLYIFVVGNIIEKLNDQFQKIKKIIKKKLENKKK